MFQWIIIIILVGWLFTLEVRIQALRQDSDEHNAKIAGHRTRIGNLEKGIK